MNTRLPLNDRRWPALDSFGRSDELPIFIRTLEGSEDPASNPVFRQLSDRIYQQYSCCEATYAVVPYLVDVGSKLGTGKNPNLWILVGHIAATCEPSLDGVSSDLLADFRTALLRAESKWIDILLTGAWDVVRTYYLGLSVIALAGHSLGKLVKDNLAPHRYAESFYACPFCSRTGAVAFFDGGLVVRSKTVIRADPPEELQMPAQQRSLKYSHRAPNPWASVALELRSLMRAITSLPGVLTHIEASAALAEAGLTCEVETGSAFSLLGALLTLKGYPKAALRYFHAWDTITCPECRATFVFADHWWAANKPPALFITGDRGI